MFDNCVLHLDSDVNGFGDYCRQMKIKHMIGLGMIPVCFVYGLFIVGLELIGIDLEKWNNALERKIKALVVKK